MLFYVRSDTLAENADKENQPLGLAGGAPDDAEHHTSATSLLSTPLTERKMGSDAGGTLL